ncbi:SET domain and MYND-type zinc finger protein 6 [Daldinia childiae]|uniref:SET domain and MYND-type zinc finger protein 6 n=1 Tax=Daldinia childiae TaxID=326645 RepID=UPI001444FDB4|nr:SET domain and MYND-type zinc finger protein 6 [Daldinia childiae]KAF3056002.1 SET domain and MYND-type zinc finger protein 6 [Daldinia childiae]
MVTLPPGIILSPPSPSRGRSILASQFFSPGAVIAVFTHGEGAPSIAIPDNPHLARTCHYCLAIASDQDLRYISPVRVRACTGCRTVYYCTPACQKADWALAHGRGECKAFRRVRAPDPAESQEETNPDHKVLPTPVRALVQVLVRPEMQAAVVDMEGHVETVRTTDPDVAWAGIELQARAALHYLNREMSKSNLAEAMEIVCKLKVNSFNRLDADINQSGTYFNPALAMINHSCVPNAFVQFVGRKAILHAFREIREGEEIEISYIECTLHRSHRQQALQTRYHFTCLCPRCKDNLDIYQVCQRYPHLELNTFSLAPDLDKIRHHPAKEHLNSSLQQYIEEIYPNCTESLQGLTLPEKSKQLRQRWKTCERLRQAELYAVEPLTQVIVDANIYFCEQSNFQYALAVSCFLALNSDPYRGPMPFFGPRVKGMFMVAKLLANTASMPPSASSDSTRSLSARISQALGKMDQATMCQAILAMVIHYCPAAHSEEWQIYHQAKDVLDDLESIPGRETENALINAFVGNLNNSEEPRFFTIAVLKPIQTLAGFALEVMDTEFGS